MTAYVTFSTFTSTTGSSGSSLTSGTITITDDDDGGNMFTVTGMLPGETETRCINVTNSGSEPFSNVAFYGAVSSTVGGLNEVLTVDIDRGTGATGGNTFSCTGFSEVTANIIASGTAFASFPASGSPVNDGTGWTAAASKSYRISLTLPSGTGNSYQNRSATLALTWDATQ